MRGCAQVHKFTFFESATILPGNKKEKRDIREWNLNIKITFIEYSDLKCRLDLTKFDCKIRFGLKKWQYNYVMIMSELVIADKLYNSVNHRVFIE